MCPVLVFVEKLWEDEKMMTCFVVKKKPNDDFWSFQWWPVSCIALFQQNLYWIQIFSVPEWHTVPISRDFPNIIKCPRVNYSFTSDENDTPPPLIRITNYLLVQSWYQPSGLDLVRKSNPTTCWIVGCSLFPELVQQCVSGSVPSCLQPLLLLSRPTRNFAGQSGTLPDKAELCRKQLLVL